jgi:galactokinase/mevalonate kinase-like predicted kinase
MGGSSILAATILKSIGTMLRIQLSNEKLIYLVSEVEQLLTTGGGWQDQVEIITCCCITIISSLFGLML